MDRNVKTGEEALNCHIMKVVLDSVRSRVLQKLLIVWRNIFYDLNNSTVALNAFKRAKEKEPYLVFNARNVSLLLASGNLELGKWILKVLSWDN